VSSGCDDKLKMQRLLPKRRMHEISTTAEIVALSLAGETAENSQQVMVMMGLG